MQQYIGTKAVRAEPAEQEGRSGYKVVYADGYESWSPKEAFEEAYRPSGAMSFGHALMVVTQGGKVRRKQWLSTPDEKTFIFLVPGSTFKVNRPPLLGIYPEGKSIDYHGHIDMKMAGGKVMPWVPQQEDLLAEDWEVVE